MLYIFMAGGPPEVTLAIAVCPDLAQFTESESWYRHGINRAVLFTDGAKYVRRSGWGVLVLCRHRQGREGERVSLQSGAERARQ
jgi:hypothetical protein